MFASGAPATSGLLPILLCAAVAAAVGWLVWRIAWRRFEATHGDVFRSKRQLQAIFDGITDGLIIVDRSFRIVAVNKAEAAFLGSTPKALVGRACY